MKKYIKGAILLLVLVGLLLANISLDVNKEGYGVGVKISEVVVLMVVINVFYGNRLFYGGKED